MTAAVAAAGRTCGTPGCGTADAYLDTSTQRTSTWVHVRGGAAPAGSGGTWYHAPTCAAAALAAPDEERAQLQARLAELAPFEELHAQTCENGQHLGWFAAVDRPLPCPWCRIAELEMAAGTHYRAARGGIILGPHMTPEGAAAACEADLYAHPVQPDPLQWQPVPDEDGVLELVYVLTGHTAATGYTVTTVTVAPAYDPEAEG